MEAAARSEARVSTASPLCVASGTFTPPCNRSRCCCSGGRRLGIARSESLSSSRQQACEFFLPFGSSSGLTPPRPRVRNARRCLQRARGWLPTSRQSRSLHAVLPRDTSFGREARTRLSRAASGRRASGLTSRSARESAGCKWRSPPGHCTFFAFISIWYFKGSQESRREGRRGLRALPVPAGRAGTIPKKETLVVPFRQSLMELFMSLGTILLIILILLLIGAIPTWPYSAGWGYYPAGGVGLILIIVLILLLLGRL